jgi:succinoglycan biosynthesis protein ExoA
MKSYPFVTVIMPIRNEGNFIVRSLGAVLSQDYPARQIEVIIADGMSDDSTREHIKKMIANSNIPVCVINNPGRIVPTGMNVALALARGEIIIRVDGHAIISPDYIHNCVRVLQQGQAECVGGPMETICETTESSTIAIAMSSPFGVGGVAFRTGVSERRYVDTVAFGAYKREALERAGLFDEELVRNQDDEYNYRLRKLGARILLTPEVWSRYYSRTSLRSLCRQYYQYGYYKVRVLQKHPRQMSARQFAPPAFVGALVLSFLMAPFFTSGKVMLLLIGGTYLVANLLATVLTWRKTESRNHHVLLILPVCFAILHLGYGSGFLFGLVRFWNRWGHQEPTAPFPTTQLQ